MRAGRIAGLTVLACGFAATVLAEDVYHDNVVIILDASGSMGETMGRVNTRKMDAAKAALKEVLRQVPETTHIGLLVFSGRNLRNEWVYPLGPRDDAELMKAVDLPHPGGGTPLGRYIKKGADRLLEERSRQFGYGSYRLLVVTDGEAEDKGLVDRYTPEVIARGITVDVIGVDMSGTHTLATKVHSYRRADDPDSLKKAVAEVFAEVSSSGTDAAQGEAFELLEPIPSDLAAAMVKALSTSGNDPIGEMPSVARRVGTPHGGPATPAPVGAPASQPIAKPGDGTGRIVLVLVFVGIAVVIEVVRRARQRS